MAPLPPRLFMVLGAAITVFVIYRWFWFLHGFTPYQVSPPVVDVTATTTSLVEVVATTNPTTVTVLTESPEGRISTEYTCVQDFDFLRSSNKMHDLQLGQEVLYARRHIKPIFSKDTNRDAVAKLSDPLIPSQLTKVGQDGCPALPEMGPVELAVPPPYSRQDKFSHMTFGVATTFGRLNESFAAFKHWLSGSSALLTVVIADWEKQNETAIKELERKFQTADMRLAIMPPMNTTYSMSRLHFAVLRDMVKTSGPEVRWFGLLDDDTFFPHLKPLSDALGWLDDSKDKYVGALSEDFNRVRLIRFMAFGGAGAFISRPLAKKVANKAQQCIEEDWKDGGIAGDTQLKSCIYRNSRAKLTLLHGLWQLDLSGDLSGFFESGMLPLSIHHWKSWFHEPVVTIATAVRYCGACFMQRFQFGNDTILSNGYSIAKYQHGLSNINLERMEGTWGVDPDNADFDFSLGLLRPAVGPEEKKSYKMVHSSLVVSVDKPRLHQLYVFRGDKEGMLDEVVELVWEA